MKIIRLLCLAIVIGAVTFAYPVGARDWEGKTDIKLSDNPTMICDQQTGNCLSLILGCQTRPGTGWDDSYFNCNNTLWAYAKVYSVRPYGNCKDGGSGCTIWATYYCVKIAAYSNSSCTGEPQCYIILSSGKRCEPGANPG